MWLSNLNNVEDGRTVNIAVKGNSITAVNFDSIPGNEAAIHFTDASVLPGLINSHDHLDFNNYPQTGNRIYQNYTQWGKDIHQHNRAAIDAVLKIPESLRTDWGLYKNLLAGITTVVNHGNKIPIASELITVHQQAVSLHSAGFENNWKRKLNNPFNAGRPVAIHTGEGTDEAASAEIDALVRWNLLRKKLVGIHGVAMSMEQAKYFKALVWCPVSNFFLLGKTAAVGQLKNNTTILFGTDSTLTAGWNIWDHLNDALQTAQLSYAALWGAVTESAAAAWNTGNGKITAGKFADIVIVKGANKKVNDGSVFKTVPGDILLVMRHGQVKLFDAALKDRLQAYIEPETFSTISLGGNKKFVAGNLPGLAGEILKYYPDAKFPFTAG